jgi:hypothetical protein
VYRPEVEDLANSADGINDDFFGDTWVSRLAEEEESPYCAEPTIGNVPNEDNSAARHCDLLEILGQCSP